MSGQYKEGTNCPCCSKGQERSSHSKKRSRGNDSNLDSSDELLTVEDSYDGNRNQSTSSQDRDTKQDYMDPIEKAFPPKDLKNLELHSSRRGPELKIDEKGFVNLARELFKSIQYRVKDTLMYCSELEFVYYSVAMLRAQQFERLGVFRVSYQPDEVTGFVRWMRGRHYPTIYDPYFDCLGMRDPEHHFPYRMVLSRDEEEGEWFSSPHVSLSKLNKLLEVQDDDALYKKLMAELYTDDETVLYSISGYRDVSRMKPTIYRQNDKHMPKPLQFINLDAIRNVECFILSIGDKIRISKMPMEYLSQDSLYPDVALIRVDDRDKGELSSRFYIRGKPLMLAAIFQLYTPAVESEMPASLSSDRSYYISDLGPCDRLIEKYVDSAFI